MSDLKKATILSTGVNVSVYRSSREDVWINYADCKTKYKPDELKF